MSSTVKVNGDLANSEGLASVCVYYDGACPSCIKDRDNYLRLAGKNANNVSWFDITGKSAELETLGIDSDKSLRELHISIALPDSEPSVLSELDAYIVLMQRVPVLMPLAWVMGLPVIRPLLSQLYHRMVHNRLKRSGRP